MTLEELLEEIREEVEIIHSNDFELEVTESTSVPNHSDSDLTYSNFDNKTKKVKKVKTAILFIDIRRSTKISLSKDAKTMAKLYDSFTRSMIRIAEHYGGKVRNIIGDRIMVVFDWATCGVSSIETALAMHKTVKEIINKNFDGNRINCGIGIDSGEVLVTKCGIIKKGAENAHYKNLTWSGTIANTASKLTDSANKYISNSKTIQGANVGFIYPWNNGEWTWVFYNTEKLVEELRKGITFSPTINYPSKYFQSLFHTTQTEYDSFSFPPILLTKSVLDELKTENSEHHLLKRGKIKKINKKIEGVIKDIYGIQ